MNKPLPVTFYITEIWPTYADFKTFTDSIPLDTTEAADNAFNEWIYNRLCRYYDEWPVRYDTPEGFANDFAVILVDKLTTVSSYLLLFNDLVHSILNSDTLFFKTV